MAAKETARKFSYPKEAALLDDMMGTYLRYHPSTDIKSANISIANGYHEAIWKFLKEHIEEAKGASLLVVKEIVQGMIDTGINRAFELILFLRSINKEWAEELVLKVAEAVFASEHPQRSYQTFLTLSEIDNLPGDLIKKGMAVNQKRGFMFLTPRESKEIIAILNANLPFWLVEKFPHRGSRKKLYFLDSKIPIFGQGAWKVIEQRDGGILLSAWELPGERFLLHKGKVVKIPNRISTLKSALKYAGKNN
jgi:hypothetical protein